MSVNKLHDVTQRIHELRLQRIIEEAELAASHKKHDMLWDGIKHALSADNDFTKWLKDSDRRIAWLEEEQRTTSRLIWRQTDNIRRINLDLVDLKKLHAELKQEVSKCVSTQN